MNPTDEALFGPSEGLSESGDSQNTPNSPQTTEQELAPAVGTRSPFFAPMYHAVRKACAKAINQFRRNDPVPVDPCDDPTDLVLRGKKCRISDVKVSLADNTIEILFDGAKPFTCGTRKGWWCYGQRNADLDYMAEAMGVEHPAYFRGFQDAVSLCSVDYRAFREAYSGAWQRGRHTAIERTIDRIGSNPSTQRTVASSLGTEVTALVPDEIADLPSLRRFELDRPCVYFLCLNKKVVYVGQSVCLGKRLPHHIKVGKKVFDEVFYIEVPKGQLDLVEARFIDKLKPPLNIAKPDPAYL